MRRLTGTEHRLDGRRTAVRSVEALDQRFHVPGRLTVGGIRKDLRNGIAQLSDDIGSHQPPCTDRFNPRSHDRLVGADSRNANEWYTVSQCSHDAPMRQSGVREAKVPMPRQRRDLFPAEATPP